MYPHILVAVDGSELSNHALSEAIALAQSQHAVLRIVHVADEITLNWEGEYGDMSTVLESFRESGRRVLEKAQNLAREAGMEPEAKLLEIQTFGHRISDLIVEEAKDWPADLIVVGTHGRRGLHDVLLGSVADGVARRASVPVLLVR
ncbi:universal stress protein [Sulfuricella sp.]|uniref:universal stress protein n=1 Tax=Sulfuricella sp. TaxID=2099377 RepID=UPI002BBB84D5|nr:universal stress protein [Sulfuricella sp.]HUX63204.1 universal stress protein [Sulfuricella sp.]